MVQLFLNEDIVNFCNINNLELLGKFTDLLSNVNMTEWSEDANVINFVWETNLFTLAIEHYG